MDDTQRPFLHRPRGLTPARLALAVFAITAAWAWVRHGAPRAWAPVLLVVPLAVAALIAARGRSLHRRRADRAPAPGAPAGDVGADGAWLQVVSGADPTRLARGLLELAAALLERGRRVPVVDGARRLRFHATLGHEGDPGLLECLAGELPVMEAIRGGAGDALCFLPRGDPMRVEVWPRLGRLLAAARPQFDQIVLALDFAAPREVGAALAGLGARGWWCPGDRASLLSDALGERIGIPLRTLSLKMPDERVREIALARAGGEIGRAHPRAEAREQGPAPAAAEPAVVDCDLQVRERLRFLLWMRRVQAEGPHEADAPRSSGASTPRTNPSTMARIA